MKKKIKEQQLPYIQNINQKFKSQILANLSEKEDRNKVRQSLIYTNGTNESLSSHVSSMDRIKLQEDILPRYQTPIDMKKRKEKIK